MKILTVKYYWFTETTFRGSNEVKSEMIIKYPAGTSFALSSFNILIEILHKGVLFKLFFTSLVLSSVLQHCALLTCALLTWAVLSCTNLLLRSFVPVPFCPTFFDGAFLSWFQVIDWNMLWSSQIGRYFDHRCFCRRNSSIFQIFFMEIPMQINISGCCIKLGAVKHAQPCLKNVKACQRCFWMMYKICRQVKIIKN